MISKVASSENDGKNLSSKILIQTLNFVPVLHPLKELLKRRPANTANGISIVVQPFVVPEGQEAREDGERCKCGTP